MENISTQSISTIGRSVWHRFGQTFFKYHQHNDAKMRPIVKLFQIGDWGFFRLPSASLTVHGILYMRTFAHARESLGRQDMDR